MDVDALAAQEEENRVWSEAIKFEFLWQRLRDSYQATDTA